ncbi:hypothetical protein COU54_03035 [Candidatus Pacearchaeota archaeon CG10_big_fil_rev_8_21_14_0_10_31_24]|nr:MAG: hypothetical protein COU54_03035 [Candidatus Pacearchaeota archaeon CG10_big_fil_rev_8_21_14_0_10_31_24]
MTDKPENNQNQMPPMSKDEQIGYHKGSISTLLAERNELIKIAQITENLVQAHAQELEKLGVKLQQDSNYSSKQ